MNGYLELNEKYVCPQTSATAVLPWVQLLEDTTKTLGSFYFPFS